ncbi:MAG: ATP-binding protein, partial [Pseudomonadota bacterium]
KYIDFATDGARRMRALIDDLLAYSRISQEAERREPFEAREGVDQAMLNLEEAIKETGAEVTVGELPRVSGNAVRFSRLMQNLIGNGLKYQAKGAVPLIGVSAERRADEWVFMVADNGIGIDEKYLEQIFEPFRRLHNHSQFAGTGIGLAACRKIVQSWSGRIWATSTLGEGTTFYFTIPVDPTFEETEAA